MKKIISKSLIAALAASSLVAVVSCTNNSQTSTEEVTEINAQSKIDNLILDAAGKAVTSSFKVPASMSETKNDVKTEYALTWTSDNNALQISSEAKDGYYTVNVTRPTSGDTLTVKLTASLKVSDTNTGTKTFKFYVNPVSVTDFASNYSFKQKNAIVYGSFDLDTELEDSGAKCQVAWESSNPEIVSIKDGVATVVDQRERTEVTLTATFTYNDKTDVRTYTVIAYHEVSDKGIQKTWYEETGDGYAYELKGYVVAKAGYTASYGNATVLIATSDLSGGYYGYRIKIDSQEEFDSLQFGTRVVISGAKSTAYNGLVETTAGATIEVITDDTVLAPLTTEQEAQLKTGHALDNDFVLGYDVVKYQTGNLVSLTAWKVESVTEFDGSKTATVYTLSKGGVKIDVAFNTYAIDASSTDATRLATEANAVQKGDYVSLTGCLARNNATYKSNSEGYVIYLVNDSKITKVENDNDASMAAGKAIKAAKEAISLPTFAKETTTIEFDKFALPEGVTYELTFNGTYETAAYDEVNKTLTFTPTAGKAEDVSYTITLKSGDYSYSFTETTVVKVLTDEELVDEALDEFTATVEMNAPVQAKLAIESTKYPDCKFTYALEADSKAEIVKGYLYATPETADYTFKVTVTATYGTITKTKDITYTVKKYETTALTATFTEGSYYYVTGVVTKVADKTKGYIYITDDKNTEFEVYGLNDIYGKTYGSSKLNVEVGDTITVYGEYSYYASKKLKEVANAVYITKTIGSAATKLENADKEIGTELKNITGATVKEETTVKLSDTYKSVNFTVTSSSPIATYDEKTATLTIKPTSESTSVTLTVTYTSTEDETATKTQTYNFTALAYTVDEELEVAEKEVAAIISKVSSVVTETTVTLKTKYNVSFEVKVGATNTVTYDSTTGKLKVNPTATETTTVTIVYTSKADNTKHTSKDYTINAILPKVYTVDAKNTVNAVYTTTKGENLKDGTDITASLGLSTSDFKVVVQNNKATTNFGGYSNSMRLYAGSGNGCSVEFSTVDSSVGFGNITLTFDSSYATVVTVYDSYGRVIKSNKDGSYTINDSSFTIKNTGTAQVRIKAIAITYGTMTEVTK